MIIPTKINLFYKKIHKIEAQNKGVILSKPLILSILSKAKPCQYLTLVLDFDIGMYCHKRIKGYFWPINEC
tara:strand:+ start:283 stop:495 length:213 start_codon:yes stop_codon:yes gene_type:complete